MKIVIRIGGSVIASPPNPKLFQEYAEIIQKIRNQEHKVVVVVGGGTLARKLIKLAKKIGLTEKEQDETAISASRVFAQLLALKIGGSEYKTIPTSIEEIMIDLYKKGIAIIGGLKPGMTTDTVAAIVASEIKADLIIKATNQEGIYTKDPQKFENTKKIDYLSFNDLDTLLVEDNHKAGIHQIIDPKAVTILKQTKIKTVVVNGFISKNLIAAIKGEKIGTLIK